MAYPSRSVLSWLATLAAVLLAGLASAAPSLSDDVLGPGDSIRVTVFQNPDLTTEARLSPEGTLRMPLIGVVSLNGLSMGEAGKRLAQRFREGNILKDPEVVVSLVQLRSRQVSVLGEVARPGRYPLDETSDRLIDVLALAGGIGNAGDDTVVVLTMRDNAPVKLQLALGKLLANADPSASLQLQNGDTVYVQRAPVFYIYGEVQRPGAYRLVENLNVMQAMALGGGITRRGTERGIRIHRQDPHGLNGALVKLEAAAADKVLPNDVIYVNESLF